MTNIPSPSTDTAYINGAPEITRGGVSLSGPDPLLRTHRGPVYADLLCDEGSTPSVDGRYILSVRKHPYADALYLRALDRGPVVVDRTSVSSLIDVLTAWRDGAEMPLLQEPDPHATRLPHTEPSALYLPVPTAEGVSYMNFRDAQQILASEEFKRNTVSTAYVPRGAIVLREDSGHGLADSKLRQSFGVRWMLDQHRQRGDRSARTFAPYRPLFPGLDVAMPSPTPGT